MANIAQVRSVVDFAGITVGFGGIRIKTTEHWRWHKWA